MAATNFTNLKPAGYEAISAVSSASAALTIPAHTQGDTEAQLALLVIETQAIRWRDDGTSPTAASGTPLAAGASMLYDGDLRTIRIMSQAGTAVVHVNYYRAR